MRRERNTGQVSEPMSRVFCAAALGGGLMLCAVITQAAEWRVTPRLVVVETYTDNVTLATAGNEQDEFVTQVNPGVSVSGIGGRARISMDYSLQNLIYFKDSDRNSSNHRLQSNGNVELVRDTLFMDAYGSISQQVVDADKPISLDNINVGNRADVVTYGLSPYAILRFGSFMDSEWRYGIDRVEASDDGQSDSERRSYGVTLRNGRDFSRLSWDGAYRNEELERDSGDNSNRENAAVNVRYRLSRAWQAVARGGYENNEIPTTRRTVDGYYWSLGAQWQPVQEWAFEATTGENNWDASVRWVPTARTQLAVSYRERDVGLNPSGVWTADISHRTRRTVWRASYLEKTTNTQTLQIIGQQNFVLVDSSGEIITDSNTGLPIILVADIFGLTDEEFRRQRGQLSVNVTTGKSNLVLSTYKERRIFEISGLPEDAYGVTASWTRRFAPRTRSLIGAGWQYREPAGSPFEDELIYGTLGLISSPTDRLNASLEYRYTVRHPSTGRDYTENRITARLTMRF